MRTPWFNFVFLVCDACSVLEAGHPLIAVHKARRLQDTDGPALGPGPFVEALEYASGVKAEVVGKPEAAFFHACLAGLDCQPEDAVMIGDVSMSVGLLMKPCSL